MYNDRTKSNAHIFTTQNSYPEQINKIRYYNGEYGGIINPLNIRLKPINKMKILPNKPEQKQLSSELNYKVICFIIIILFILGFISFFLVYFLKKPEKINKITGVYKGKNIKMFNETFENLINKILIKNQNNILRHLNQKHLYTNTNENDIIEVEIYFPLL